MVSDSVSVQLLEIPTEHSIQNVTFSPSLHNSAETPKPARLPFAGIGHHIFLSKIAYKPSQNAKRETNPSFSPLNIGNLPLNQNDFSGNLRASTHTGITSIAKSQRLLDSHDIRKAVNKQGCGVGRFLMGFGWVGASARSLVGGLLINEASNIFQIVLYFL